MIKAQQYINCELSRPRPSPGQPDGNPVSGTFHHCGLRPRPCWTPPVRRRPPFAATPGEDTTPEGSHLGLPRRGFLGASAAALAASALPCGSYAQYPQSAKYRRWEITDPNMPATVLTSYKTAVRAMLKLPSTAPPNWYPNPLV